MDWQHIKTLGALAKHRTVRSTARVLSIHHSTVSRHIDQLESDVGSKLFIRNTQGYQLTAAGEHMTKLALKIEHEISRTNQQISGIDDPVEGRLRVAVIECLAVQLLAPQLHLYQNAFPNIELEILTSTSSQTKLSGNTDVAILLNNRRPNHEHCVELFECYYCLYANPLQQEISDEAIETFRRFYLSDQESAMVKTRIASISDTDRFTVWGKFESVGFHAALARAGCGVSVLPCFVGDSDPSLVRVSGISPRIGKTIWLAYQSMGESSARVQSFIQFAQEAIKAKKELIRGEMPARL